MARAGRRAASLARSDLTEVAIAERDKLLRFVFAPTLFTDKILIGLMKRSMITKI